MIGIDTNVLVRFLVEDDAAQTAEARRLLAREQEAGRTLHVGDVVLAELVWVLRHSYRIAKTEIVDILDRLLRAKHLAFSSADRLERVLERFRVGSGDFADYLIEAEALEAGCRTLATFDRSLLREPSFRSPADSSA